nr:hypothetical protein [Pseudodesulfovibrio sp.]
MNDLVSVFQRTLPEILWRHQWPTYRVQYGLPFARGTMQNFDSAGTGPKHETLGGLVYYTKKNYLEWLSQPKQHAPLDSAPTHTNAKG